MTHDPKEVLHDARRKLEVAGSPSPARDASALMDKVQGDAPPWTPLSDAQLAELQGYIQRRARREPVSQIVGKRRQADLMDRSERLGLSMGPKVKG